MRPIAIIDRGRGPELAGTRITIFDILPYAEAGHTPTTIAAVLRLSTAQVEALLQYLEQHRTEIMSEYQKIVERIARGNSAEVESRQQASRARLLALQRELQHKGSHMEVNGAGYPG